MSGRPCNPDSDFKRLWQVFLRGTPLPQCSVPPERESTAVVTEGDPLDAAHSAEDRAIGDSAAREG